MAQGLHPVRVLVQQVLVAGNITDHAGVPLCHGRAAQHVPLALLLSAAPGAAEVGLAQLEVGLQVHHPDDASVETGVGGQAKYDVMMVFCGNALQKHHKTLKTSTRRYSDCHILHILNRYNK